MQYTAPILGKVFSHVSLVLVWSSSRKTCLPNLSRQQNQTKNTSLVFFVCHLNLSFFQLLTRIVLITHPFEQ